MKRRYHRIGFTAAQSAELWERWKKGESLKSIGRVIGKPSLGDSVSVCGFLEYTPDQANIYLDEKHSMLVDLRRCIAVAVRKNDVALHATATNLSGRLVEIRGKKARLCMANEICQAWCADIGLVIESVNPK